MKIYEKIRTEFSINFNDETEQAFILGLLWGKCPAWFWKNLEKCYSWLEPKANLSFSFIADSAASWYEAYRELRRMGWIRFHAGREGGVITYGLALYDESWPESYKSIRVIFRVSLSTCKQVKVGTKQVEVDVFETQCEDMTEPSEAELEHAGEAVSIDAVSAEARPAEEPSL